MMRTPSSQRKLRQRTRSGRLTLASPISSVLNTRLTKRPVKVVQHDKSLPNSKPSALARAERIKTREGAKEAAAKARKETVRVATAHMPLADLLDEEYEAEGEGLLRQTPDRRLFTPTSAGGSERVLSRDVNLWTYSSEYLSWF